MRTRFITLAAACATLAGCGSGGNGSLPQLTAATPATRSACESLQSGFAFADTTITAAAAPLPFAAIVPISCPCTDPMQSAFFFFFKQKTAYEIQV